MSASTVANGAAIHPSPEVVEAILKWSLEDRRDLAMLLQDSVREGFTSLSEAEVGQRNLIQNRLDELMSGAELVEPDAVFAEIRRRVAEVRKQ